MARGVRRGKSKLLSLSCPVEPQSCQNDESHPSAIQERHQVEVLANESNRIVIDGKKIAKIDKEDVENEIEYWQNAVIYSVLGVNPPNEIMQGQKGVFMIRFQNIHDKLAMEKKGIYYFDAKPVLVKGWNPKMDLQTENIKFFPIWVQLPELDIKF
ncbi:hypothetical protein Cgig2_032287 [Carnegiea gigantea]|uniref:DUF4283 domain-containing protein n=1 Tax=Carnegiea gigantea TaxID=171969 RepID=A0A9Q1JG10_9CARY|nr:hypothetical protein Cgig2_032287 [Carnegiea gigantea]